MNNQKSTREEMEMLHRVNLNLMQDLQAYRDQSSSLRYQITELKRELEEKTLLLKYANEQQDEIEASTRNEAIYILQENYHKNYIN